MKILFLGETYRADAQTWINGIEEASGFKIDTDEIKTIRFKPIRAIQAFLFIGRLLWGRFFGPKYDIVLAERSTSYGFFSLFTNAKLKVVAQQGISDIFPNTFISRNYKRVLQHLVYRRVDLVHAWGSAMVPAMLFSGASPKKILVRPKGIDLRKFNYKSPNSEGVKIKAIVTRSLLPEYNHWVIINSVAQLVRAGVYVELTVIGDGSLMQNLKKLALDLEISHLISYVGRIPNEELPNYLQSNDLYLSTPITEGASSSLMEAMACGLYPIVTKLPGNLSFIENNKNGKLVDVGSVASLVNAVVEYTKLSKMEIESAVNQNRVWIENFGNRENNMKFFWKKYLEIHSSKNESVLVD